MEIIAHGIKLSKRQSAWPIYSVPCGEDEPFSASQAQLRPQHQHPPHGLGGHASVAIGLAALAGAKIE
ncbi:hypothetical protein ACC771_10885, partial [Rhizobium ruizarguesonis]